MEQSFFINTDNALVNVPAHSVSTLEKSLYFYATLMTIDSSLDSETITQEMAKFKNIYSNSTNIISNDLTIFDNYLNRISDLFNNKISYEKNQENGNSVVDFYIESIKDYVNIKTINQEYIVLETLKSLESQLPDNFIRVHKSYLVNINKIKSILQKIILLNSEKEIPIGDSYKYAFMEKLK